MSEAEAKSTRKRHLSFRLKLTLWVVGVFAAVELAVASVVLLYQRSDLWRRFEGQMSAQLSDLLGEVGTLPEDWSTLDLIRMTIRESDYLYVGDLLVVVFDEAGQLHAATQEPAPELLAELTSIAARASVRPALARSVVREADGRRSGYSIACQIFTDNRGDRFTMCIASPDAYATAGLRTATIVLLLVLPAGLLVAGGAAWWVGSLAAAPLRDATQYARRLTPETVGEQTIEIHSHGSEADELREALEEARQRLRAGYDMQSRFLANISHELKTPISVLIAQAETLRRRAEMPEEGLEFLESSVEELERLGKLIESFLLLTRVREGKARIHDRRCSLNEVVMDSVEHCAGMADLYGVTLHPTLIESDEPEMIFGEPELIRTAIDNLIRNAVRFSPKGESVDVAAVAEDGRLRVSVRDRGPGVPVDILPRLFDRFTQSPNASRRGRGSGLGLSIAQGIAELHGGEITAENLERGCRFSVLLPRLQTS